MNEVSNNPLHFFNILIEQNGIQKLYESFLFDMEMLNGSFVNDSNEMFSFTDYAEGKLVLLYEKFDNKLLKEFSEAYQYFISNATENIGATPMENKQELAIFFLNELQFLFNKIGNYKKDLVEHWIIKAASYLRQRFKNFVKGSPYFIEFIEDEKPDGYFDFKGKRNQLKELYEKLLSVDFISEETTNFSTFKKIIEAQNLKELYAIDGRIIINCDMQKAAYIIGLLKDHFKNLTDKTIQEFPCFINNKNKSLSLNNIQSQRSKYINNPLNEEEIKQLQLIFSTLI